MEPFVEAHAINTYVFCPRRCYYEYVERVFYHNAYTLHGKLVHEHVDSYGREKREDRELYRSIFIRSEQYCLSVRCDLVEEKDGQIYPVEYKRGRKADWENNFLQLCAQALALEEYLGVTISVGYLFFYESHQRLKVELTPELRERTKKVIKEIQKLYKLPVPPAGIDDWKKCPKCSMADYCLPKERIQLKGKIKWEHFI